MIFNSKALWLSQKMLYIGLSSKWEKSEQPFAVEGRKYAGFNRVVDDGRVKCPTCSEALSEVEEIDDDIEATGYIEVKKQLKK